MGGSASKSAKNTIQSTLNETINRSMTETNNSAECKSDVQQTMIINMDDVNLTGSSSVTIGQTTKVNMSCFVENVNAIATDVQKDVTNLLSSETDISKLLENSGFTLGKGVDEETEEAIQQYIENRLVNETESVINNAINLDQSASNTLVFNMGKLNMSDEASFTLTQEGIIDVIGENIAKNMVDTILEETNTNIDDESSTTDVEGTNTGWGWESYLSMFLIIAVVGGVIVFGLWQAGKTVRDPGVQQVALKAADTIQTSTPTGAAANMLKGGAKKLINKTTLLTIILIILIFIAYKLT
jgi:hypothetical protein